MNRRLGPVLRLAMALLTLGSCADRAPAPAEETDAPRIVSLSPAISRTLVDVGLASHVVGRTPFCDALDASIPAVGDLLHVDYERLVRLRPTHLLIQPPASGLDPALERLAEREDWTIGAWRLRTIGDVRTLLRDLTALFDDPGGDLAEGCARAEAAIDAALAAPAGAEMRGRVLVVGQVEPVLVFGRATYLDEIVTALGWSNACADEGWIECSMEDVVRLDPDAVLVVRSSPPGGERDAAADAIRALPITAARAGRVRLLVHADAMLPSSAVAGVAREMASVLDGLAEP